MHLYCAVGVASPSLQCGGGDVIGFGVGLAGGRVGPVSSLEPGKPLLRLELVSFPPKKTAA